MATRRLTTRLPLSGLFLLFVCSPFVPWCFFVCVLFVLVFFGLFLAPLRLFVLLLPFFGLPPLFFVLLVSFFCCCCSTPFADVSACLVCNHISTGLCFGFVN